MVSAARGLGVTAWRVSHAASWWHLVGCAEGGVQPCEIRVVAEHWERVLGVNVVGTFLVSQAALPLLREAPDGWIVNITSIAGIRQTGSSLPYAVSKAALDHLTTILAKHAGGGVRVNAVAPGLVATPWTETWDQLKAGVEAIAPLHRVATPGDIAEACASLVATRYATGQTLLVDGGLGLVI